jgi:hypothetical protein
MGAYPDESDESDDPAETAQSRKGVNSQFLL